MNNVESALERILFGSRWLLAPFFFGLMLATLALLVKFGVDLFALLQTVVTGTTGKSTLIAALVLIDTALIAGLLLIVSLAGYENFVSKLDIGEHVDRPAWMGRVGFSDLKIKVIGAIVIISAVELLIAYLQSTEYSTEELLWKAIIHLTFVVSGVLFAITDWINRKSHP